jgi:hypothetical protein
MTIGSCFSDEIGTRLASQLFDIDVNPLGTLYNPMSIAKALNAMMDGNTYASEDLVMREGLWHSFDFHSRFSGSDRQSTVDTLNVAMHKSRVALQECTHLFVTFGTAYVYSMPGYGIVANCHKFPASQFHRRMVSVGEITDVWVSLLNKLAGYNPNLAVVFTVSPIRHLSDGAHGNQLSKSTLHLSIASISDKTNNAIEYFPAYEIVMDDLRDYRFYASDFAHPSDLAVDYIYDKFAQMFFDRATAQAAVDADKLMRFAQHRPLNTDSVAISRHETQLKQKIESLLAAHPEMQRAIDKCLNR